MTVASLLAPAFTLGRLQPTLYLHFTSETQEPTCPSRPHGHLRATYMKPWVRYTLIAIVVLVILGGIAIAIGLHYADPYLHAKAIAMLEDKFHSDVDLK